MVAVLRSGFLLGLVLVSITLAVAQLVSPRALYESVGLNQIPPETRNATITTAAVLFVLGLGVAIAAQLRGGSALQSVERLSELASPLLIVALLPGMFVRGMWARRELYFLIFAGACALILERLL